MNTYVNKIDQSLNSVLESYVQKPSIVRGIVHLLLVLYVVRLAPSLPQQVLALFENQYFRLFIFSLVLWTAQFSPSTSLLIALGFMITMNYVNEKPLWEFLENTEDNGMPVAESEDIAKEAAVATIEEQLKAPEVITEVVQQSETIVVQPIVQNGQVVNPNVVVAPAVVQNENGETLVVKPKLQVLGDIEPKQQETPFVQPTNAVEMGDETMPAPEEYEKKEQQSCYPLRSFDYSQISPFGSGGEFQEVKF